MNLFKKHYGNAQIDLEDLHFTALSSFENQHVTTLDIIEHIKSQNPIPGARVFIHVVSSGSHLETLIKDLEFIPVPGKSHSFVSSAF